MDREATAANIGVGFDREAVAQQRHKDLMALIPQALKRSNVIGSTVIVPLDRNSAFVGRTNELRMIHSYLTGPKPHVDAGPSVVAIQGIGGIGKTQLALNYLFQNKAAYKGRFWIRSDKAVIIQQDFAQISIALDTGDDGAVVDLKKAVQKVKDWLATTGMRISRVYTQVRLTVLTVRIVETWLLVFDNVNAIADIQEYLPTSGTGSVIITTRDMVIADGLSHWTKTVRLEGLQSNDAKTLLRQINPGIPQSNLTDNIIDELGGLPLALSVMGNYIRQTMCSLDDFKIILQSHSERLYSDKASMPTVQYRQAETLASCCDLSIELLSPDIKYLLGVLAFFQTDALREELITKGCAGISRMSHLADAYNWNDAIRTLARHSLLTATQETSHRNLQMHRVIKRRAIHVLEAAPDESTEAFGDAATLLNGMFPRRPSDGGTMTKNWSDCEVWLPHVLSLWDGFNSSTQRQKNIPRPYAEILCNSAWYMWERGTARSFELGTHALDVGKQSLADDDPLLSDMYTVIGALRIARFQSRKECSEAFQDALRVRQRHMAKTTNPSLDEKRMLANVHNNAGVGKLVLEEVDEALALFQESLELKYLLGDETVIPYDIGISVYNVCRVQMFQGLIEEAKKNAKKALDLVEAYNGRDDFRTNQFRFTYADLLVASGEVEEGLATHIDTLEIRKKVMGDENNDTGVSYYGLGCVYQQLGRLEDAL